MRVVSPFFELFSNGRPLSEQDGVELLRWIERNARISHRSEDAQTPDSWQRFIKAVVLEHGDWSVVEHANLNAVIRTDRGVMAELTRHRVASFTIESTRFVRYGNKHSLEFIQPSEIAENKTLVELWTEAMEQAENTYTEMLANRCRPQEARSVLPNSLACTISLTANLRTWRHLLLMRTSQESHPDMRFIMTSILHKVKQCIPLLFDDIPTFGRQIENIGRPR